MVKLGNKISSSLPNEIEGIIKCENPRCITSVEKYIPHVFYAVNKEKGEYKCKYCDEIYKIKV